ncbi:hypothetical protein [Burkholderia ubonensis]|uniref:hypothetical protein n=1 Tax=Burkholderia ubonensis TaxID=101571 RepID=UPI0012FA274A|nr:hypothetical protein [Burkholderia ubonensis]
MFTLMTSHIDAMRIQAAASGRRAQIFDGATIHGSMQPNISGFDSRECRSESTSYPFENSIVFFWMRDPYRSTICRPGGCRMPDACQILGMPVSMRRRSSMECRARAAVTINGDRIDANLSSETGRRVAARDGKRGIRG